MKRGFTLVELLAVIVILSVIAIITVPIIGNVIEESKKKALEQSAYGLLEAADYLALSSNQLEHFTFTENGVESITENKLDYKGKIDAVGDLYIDEEGDISLCLSNDKYYVYKSYKMNDQVVIEEKKDNQTCIIGKDLLTNKYLAYAGEEGSSVNDSYYTKGEVNNLLTPITTDITNIKKDLQDVLDIASQNQSDISDINSLLGNSSLTTTAQTLTGAVGELKSTLDYHTTRVNQLSSFKCIERETGATNYISFPVIVGAHSYGLLIFGIGINNAPIAPFTVSFNYQGNVVTTSNASYSVSISNGVVTVSGFTNWSQLTIMGTGLA